MENETSSGRRSGRIAKTASILQERLKKEEELDRQLKAREKKEKAATKRKHMEIRKAMREAERGEKRKRRLSVQSVSSAASNASTDAESSSDCEVEKVVVKKSAKLAAIFMGKKEKEVVKEDPAVTAR